ncbi:MAG: hypothetical protein BBJ57_07505 [Desulfobacterales bacterium PC51MH44]|nr:MAG: hypothetical protein BBJ57_07505 [Desulfobacterales bacterium PC51MH44]
MGYLQGLKNRAKVSGDNFTRNRFRQHNRAMSREGRDQRSSERELAFEAGGSKKFSKAQEGAWHTYIIEGGTRPDRMGFGGAGSGGGPGGMGEAPTLNMPEYDDREVSKLAQKKAAPGVRKLRTVTQQALSSTHENPNVQKMTVRDALAGYGTGLENVMAGAERSAANQYGQQYSASVNAEFARFDAANRRQMAEFDVSSRNFLMEREHQLNQQYNEDQDPYAAFEEFYS